jgi:hypothetical protein
MSKYRIGDKFKIKPLYVNYINEYLDNCADLILTIKKEFVNDNGNIAYSVSCGFSRLINISLVDIDNAWLRFKMLEPLRKRLTYADWEKKYVKTNIIT